MGRKEKEKERIPNEIYSTEQQMRSFRESGHRHSARNARGGENHPGWSSVTRCLRTILAPLSPSPSLFFSPLSTLSSTNIFFSLPFLPSLSPPLLLTRLSLVFFFYLFLSFSPSLSTTFPTRFRQNSSFFSKGEKIYRLFVSPRSR